MEYAKSSYLSNLFQLAIYTGLRIGELGGLLWDDVDMKNRVIHVRHTLIDNLGGGWRNDTPKSKTSMRDVPMLPQAYEVLKRQETEYKKEHGNITKLSNDDFVFSVLDEPIRRKRVEHEIGAMLNKMANDGIDFPTFTMHTTRHTFATRCMEEGMDPNTLKTILGHSTISMTCDIYSHVLPDVKKNAMDKVASAF